MSKKILLKEDDVAYIYLPDHPEQNVQGCVKKTARMCDLIDGYKGPDILLDFDANGVCIGIEVLA